MGELHFLNFESHKHAVDNEIISSPLSREEQIALAARDSDLNACLELQVVGFTEKLSEERKAIVDASPNLITGAEAALDDVRASLGLDDEDFGEAYWIARDRLSEMLEAK